LTKIVALQGKAARSKVLAAKLTASHSPKGGVKLVVHITVT
jgi:hypothetical protein